MKTRIYVSLMLILFGAFLCLCTGCSSKPYRYNGNWQYNGQYGSQDIGRGQR